LLVLTVVLVPLGAVLAIVGNERGFEASEGWESRLLLAGLGGAVALLFSAVGLLIARAEPRNAIGWIFLGAAAMLAADTAAFGYADLAVFGEEPWPAAAWVAWFANWSFIPPVFIAPCLVAQLFPDGRPLRGPWRWVLGVSIAVGIVAALSAGLAPGPIDSYAPVMAPVAAPEALGGLVDWVSEDSGVFLAPPVMLASLAALVVRFRRSRGIERQQMKWLALAGAVPVTAFALTFVLNPIADYGLVLNVIFIAGFAALMLIPVAVAIAILRYRLYEIDRVISRTIVYGAVTLILGAAYVGLVLAGQAVFSSFAGGSDLAIAASTLVVAALFLPLRSRVQTVVDRRFYRRRYDAQRTLESFGARLREQVDLPTLTGDLRAVVDETMQPAHVSLWLREAHS
jgi:hypothetical protein